MSNRIMPADHKVSVAWQIVATFVPIANFWAYYRIRKLRKYIAFIFAPSIVLSVALYIYLRLVKPQYTAWGDDGLAFGSAPFSDLGEVIACLIAFGLQGFAIYLVIIWSRQHNKQFDSQPA